MNCRHCGTALTSDARFCPGCGGAVAPTEPAPQAHSPSATAALIGREVAGRYRILEKLGEGGMGAVFRAEQISLKRKVALKLLRPELSANAGLVRRFNAEAELAAKLSHPNTVTLFDFGQDADGSLFIAMEYVEGESLRDAMARSGPLPPARALAICEQVCASLADAHAVGIVHRDLKPDNVMLTTRGGQRDVVRVLDFGIAKLRDERSDGTSVPMTQQGDLLGTPQYMAPEQIRAEPVDGRTDVYALGAMLYEMITGRLPFEGPTVMAILSKHLTEAPVPPMERRRDLGIPPHINQLVLDCMSKDRQSRPATMEIVRARLRQLSDLLAKGALSAAGRPASMPIKRFQSRPPGVPQKTPPRGATPMPRPPTAPPAPPAATPAPVGYPAPAAYSSPMPPASQRPLQAGPGPAMAPAPTPIPIGGAARPGSSKAWLWIVAALVLVGGGVAAVIVFRNTSPPGDSANAAPAQPAPEAATVDDGFRSPISGDFSTHPDRKLYDVEDDDVDDALDDVGDSLDTLADLGATGFVPKGTVTGGGAYVDSTYGYRIEMPDGFSVSTDPANPGMVTGAGLIDGEMAMVVGVAMAVDPKVLGDAGMKAAADNIAAGFGGTVVKVERRSIAGAQLYTGVYDMQGAMRMEVVLYPGSGYVLAVAFGAPTDSFARTASARADLFEHRVELR